MGKTKIAQNENNAFYIHLLLVQKKEPLVRSCFRMAENKLISAGGKTRPAKSGSER